MKKWAISWKLSWKLPWKSLQESGLLIKDVREAMKNEAKKQKGGFIGHYVY